MNPALVSDLSALFKGRGLHRPGVRRWLGATLASALDVPEGRIDEQ